MKKVNYLADYLTPAYTIVDDSIVPFYPFQKELIKLDVNESVSVNNVYMDKENANHWRKKYDFLECHKKERTIPKFIELNGEDIKRSLANLSQLTLEVTDACNLRCKYCGYGELYEDHDERIGQYIDEQAVQCLLDYLADLWNSPLNTSHGQVIYISFYGGEPLMNMQFIKHIMTFLP